MDSQASPSLPDVPPPWPRIKTCEDQGPRHSDAQANSGDTVVSDGRKKHHPGIESGPAVNDFLSRTQSKVLMSHKATQFKQWLRVPEHTGDKTQNLLFSKRNNPALLISGFLLLICSIGDGTQGLTHTGRVFYLSPIPDPVYRAFSTHTHGPTSPPCLSRSDFLGPTFW